MKVLVCLPTYNEEKSIRPLAEKIIQMGYDLVVTDGGSTDQTVSIARNMNISVLERKGKGKGFGIRQALDYAYENGYQAFAYADCDMTYPVEDFPKMVAELPENDLVTGVRKMERIAAHRRLVNLFFLLMVKILYGRSIGDLITGMRVLKVEKYYGKLTAPAFEIETEISCLALRENYKIKEVPVVYSDRIGESKISVWDFFTNWWYIIKVRFTK